MDDAVVKRTPLHEGFADVCFFDITSPGSLSSGNRSVMCNLSSMSTDMLSGGCNSETMVPLMEHLQALGCGCASDNQLTIVISGAVGGVARP